MSTELGKRIATGVIGGLALLALIIRGGWPGIYGLSAILSLGMTYEYATMVFTQSDRTEKIYAQLCMTWFVALASLLAGHETFEVALVMFMACFIYYLFSAKRHPAGPELRAHFHELTLSFFGLIYVGFLPCYLPRIHESSNGVEWTITFLLIVFAGDTGAYFAGKKYGKTPLYPAISPKKTVEGAAGGLLAGYVLALFSKAVFFHEMPWTAIAVTPLAVGVVAQVGDFCESLVKRAFDKKDSSLILPGHGGLLDRFDGVVFSLPVMYACVRLFG